MCKTHIVLRLSGAYELLQKACEWINEYQRRGNAVAICQANVIKSDGLGCEKLLGNNGRAEQSTGECKFAIQFCLIFGLILRPKKKAINIFNGQLQNRSNIVPFPPSSRHCVHVIKFPLIELSIFVYTQLVPSFAGHMAS